jgi:hypothetical protein
VILRNDLLQCLECSICGDVVELRVGVRNDAETLVILMERLAADHAPCEEFKDDPRKARMERTYHVGMRVALAGLK